jgi:hypothetical protein
MRRMVGPKREERGGFRAIIASGIKMILVIGLVTQAVFPRRSAEAVGPTVNQLDVKVTSLKATDYPGHASTGILVAKEGDDVYFQCSWMATTTYADYYVGKEIKFTGAVTIDGKPLATFEDRVVPNHYGKNYAGTPSGGPWTKKWKAAGPGKHAIQCQADPTNKFNEKPEWKQDSQMTIQLVVQREVKEGEIPAPNMLNPPAGAQYQLGDNLKIPMGFRADDAFFKLAKDKIIPELWFRSELEYESSSGTRGGQSKTVILSGGLPFSAGATQMSANPVEDFLTSQEIKKKGLGEGKYTYTVYFSAGGKSGPKGRRSFMIHGPLSVKGGTEAKGAVTPPAPAPKAVAPVPPATPPPTPPKRR